MKITVFLIITLLSGHAFSETYIRDYTYNASEVDSKVTSRKQAITQVKLLLLQEIGTHIRHKLNIRTDSSGKTVSDEDIEALTAGFTQVKVLNEKWNGETYYLKAELTADTDSVLHALEGFKNNNSQMAQLVNEAKGYQVALQKANETIKRLRAQLERKDSSNLTQPEKETLVNKYTQEINKASEYDKIAQFNTNMLYKFDKHINNDEEEELIKLIEDYFLPTFTYSNNVYYLGNNYSSTFSSRDEYIEKNISLFFNNRNSVNILDTKISDLNIDIQGDIITISMSTETITEANGQRTTSYSKDKKVLTKSGEILLVKSQNTESHVY